MPGPNDELIRLLLDMGLSKDNVQNFVDKLKDLEAESNKAAAGDCRCIVR